MLKTLPDGPLDIVGDIHGEYEALDTLMYRLGYDRDGRHPRGRRLVFVGDLVDRGPDSPRVLNRVRGIVESGRGDAILGNHELNLLRGERKDGNDWFWGENTAQDRKYSPFKMLLDTSRLDTLEFFASLPLALERQDLRIVHAAWHEPSLKRLGARPPGLSMQELFKHWEEQAEVQLAEADLLERSRQERRKWEHALVVPDQTVPFLDATAACDELRQMANPIRVLTSGVERAGNEPFFSSGQWRFVERVKWWDEYTDDTPIVVGHYWRRVTDVDRLGLGKADPNLFEQTFPSTWHGARANVFCVDFSAGGRFHERRNGSVVGATTKLAALRWPEKILVFDTGEEFETTTGALR
jgi:hypothetical protein